MWCWAIISVGGTSFLPRTTPFSDSHLMFPLHLINNLGTSVVACRKSTGILYRKEPCLTALRSNANCGILYLPFDGKSNSTGCHKCYRFLNAALAFAVRNMIWPTAALAVIKLPGTQGYWLSLSDHYKGCDEPEVTRAFSRLIILHLGPSWNVFAMSCQ